MSGRRRQGETDDSETHDVERVTPMDEGAAGTRPGPGSRDVRRRRGAGQVAAVWADLDPFRADDDSPREKRYALTMFPYPAATCTWVMPRSSRSRRHGALLVAARATRC